MTTTDKPRATIVIEWENIQLAEEDRSFTMLGVLAEQIAEQHRATPAGQPNRFEVLLLYNSEACDGEEIRRGVAPFFENIKTFCTLELRAAAGTTYYEQKNAGARLAAADVVVYLDSDVIPEPGWLAALLTPFKDPNVQIVSGNSYLTASDAYSKAFALFWFFPLRAQKVVFEKRPVFFANNVAFRREVIVNNPFTAVAGTTRGSCVYLAHRLRAAGIPIHYHSAARVSHPAPNGFKHFFIRGLAQGRDRVFLHRVLNRSFLRSLPKTLILPFRSSWRIIRHRRVVGMSLVELPAAIIIALVFNTLILAGEFLSRLAPDFTKSRWQI